MPLHRFGRNISRLSWILGDPAFFLLGKKRPLTIRNDIRVSQVEVGGEPEFRHEDTWQLKIESEKSMIPIRGIEKQTARQDRIARRNRVRFHERPDAPFRTIGHPCRCL